MLTVGAAAAVVALAPQAAGAAPSRQTATVSLTTTEPGAAVGSTQALAIRNPADPNAKPHAVKTIVFRLAPGTVIDTSALPQCKASDADLMARGAAACPAESRVNTGVARSDTGATAVFPRYVNTDVQNFNNDGELVGVADAREIPFRSVSRSKITGSTITFDVPESPGQGPPDDFSALTDLRIVSPPLVRAGRAYTRTPPSCPPSGLWEGSIEFIYHDGVRQTVQTRSPCRRSGSVRRDRTAPRIRLRGVPSPRRCAPAAFRARALARDGSGVRRVAMYVDGRFIGDARGGRLVRRVRARRGKHRLTVLARDGAGNRARRSKLFRRCRGTLPRR